MSFIISIVFHVIAIVLAVVGIIGIATGATQDSTEILSTGITLLISGGFFMIPARGVLILA
jgi:hypothetical protein